MSEPSETSGRPLTTTTKQEKQPEGSTIHPSSSTHTAQRNSSPPSDDCNKATKSFSPRRRPGTITKAPSDPHVGPSRLKQQSTSSIASMMSRSPSINYTRTGRISKAKKGLKVHNCECGRSYTRAEHLRRHQKNHAQEDALVCDYPDCGKTFFRPDLLHRHMEKHNEPGHDSLEFSPEGTPEARSPSVPETAPTLLTATPMYYALPPASSTEGHTVVPSTKYPISTVGHPPVSIAMTVEGERLGWHDHFGQSPAYSSSDGYASPNIGSGDYSGLYSYPTYGHDVSRTRTPSNASVNGHWPYTPRSPISTDSSNLHTWGSNDKSMQGFAYMNTPFPISSHRVVGTIEAPVHYSQYVPRTMMQRDEDEAGILFRDQPYGMGRPANTFPSEQYLNNYWRLFHPTFPVVHRLTFGSLSVSPLLSAAMIAVDGQYSSDTSTKRNARVLHDRCIKMLSQREKEMMVEADRLCDEQAVFLIEVLSQYRGRRAAKILSPRFGTLYRKMAENFNNTRSKLTDIVFSLAQPENVTPNCWLQWVKLSTWQRLLVSCYRLETEQAMLLARKPVLSLFQESGMDLPFPAHLLVWDAMSFHEWAVAVRQYSSPQYVCDVSEKSTVTSCDPFQSSVLVAAYYNRFNVTSPYEIAPSVHDIDFVLDTSFVTKQRLLTAKLIQVTPIRALIAISGETWILFEKVSQQDFFTLKTALRTWIAQLWNTQPQPQPPAVTEALQLSVDILQSALDEKPAANALGMGTDMGVYFASLVLWAVVTVASTRLETSPHPSPSLHAPVLIPTSLPTSFSTFTLTSTPRQPAPPIRHDSFAATSFPHDQIMFNSASFLAAMRDFNPMLFELGALQTGCVSMLLWVKLQLRGAPFDGDDEWASGSGDGLGELMDSVVGSLERMLKGGWGGWEI